MSNVKSTPLALDFYVSKKSKDLYSSEGIYSPSELDARHEIMLENYTMKIQIEGRVMGDLAINHIVPTAISYQNKLIENVKGLKEIGLDKKLYAGTIDTITEISNHISSIKSNVDEMITRRKEANKLTSARDMAIAYDSKVRPYFDTIRYHVDKLELMVDDEDWPLVKYRELLFLR